MTPAVDYKKALEVFRAGNRQSLVGNASQYAYVFSRDDIQRIEQALQPCAEAMTEDELVNVSMSPFDAESEAWIEIYRYGRIRQIIRALAKSGHLKVKA